MGQADAFLGLLEASIGMAGFTAIVVVLGTRQRDLSQRAAYSVRGALSNSMGAAIAALVALGVSAVGMDGTAQWRVSSAIYLIPALGIGGFLFHQRLGLSLARSRSRSERAISAAMWSVYGIHNLIHVANVLGFPFLPSFGAYFLASVIILAIGGFQFLLLTFRFLRPAA